MLKLGHNTIVESKLLPVGDFRLAPGVGFRYRVGMILIESLLKVDVWVG